MTQLAYKLSLGSQKLPILIGFAAVHARAANDNVRFETSADALRNAHVQSALRLLASHGLKAAHHAYDMAQKSRANNDRLSSDKWMQICRILDRRLAQKMERSSKVG